MNENIKLLKNIGNKNYFSSNVKYLRKLQGLTQNDLADKLGKSRKTISAWEAGRRSPIVADLMEVSAFFNVDIVDLFDVDLSIPPQARTIDESELIMLFSKLTAEQQSAVMTTIKSMIQK